MRVVHLIGAAAVVLLAACVDFGLDERRYRCADDPEICGPGWTCGADGFCTRGQDPDSGAPPIDAAVDAAPVTPASELCDNGVDDDGDGDTDCRDDDCGALTCNDDNPCTADTCNADGTCSHQALGSDTSCGTGCVCTGGALFVESACGDGVDNDDDGAIDCQDSDCPKCGGATMCCAEGACRVTCG